MAELSKSVNLRSTSDRFYSRKRNFPGIMETVDIQAMESKLSDVTVTAIPMNNNKSSSVVQASTNKQDPSQSKYAQLLGVIEEMGREVRPTYAGSRSSAERLKRNIVSARILVRECLIETERSARQ